MHRIFHALALCCALPAFAQTQQPVTTLTEALRSLASRADTAFAGEVLTITPTRGAVVITFRVDSALQGAPGTTYTLHEWSGLWSAGQRRFWLGERAAFFFHAPSPITGFATPVDDMDGVLPITNLTTLNLARLSAGVARKTRTALPPASSLAIAELPALLAPTGFARPAPIRRPPLPPLRPAPVRTLDPVVSLGESLAPR